MIDNKHGAMAAHFRAEYLEMSYSRTTVDISLDIKIQQPKLYQPSDDALTIMSYIADSQKLTGQEKSSIIRLLAMADTHTTGKTHDKLMHAIAALVGLMEFNARMREDQPKHSLEEVLGYYQEQRRLLDPSGGQTTTQQIRVDVHMEVEQFSLRYVGVDVQTAQKNWQALKSQGQGGGPQVPLRVEGMNSAASPNTSIEV